MNIVVVVVVGSTAGPASSVVQNSTAVYPSAQVAQVTTVSAEYNQ